MFILIVVIGGVETTSHSLVGPPAAWEESPQLSEKVRSTGEAPGSMIEETVRWASPALNFGRTASEQHELAASRLRQAIGSSCRSRRPKHEVGALLGMPDDYTQAGMLAVGHTIGLDFRQAPRRPVSEVSAWNGWT